MGFAASSARAAAALASSVAVSAASADASALAAAALAAVVAAFALAVAVFALLVAVVAGMVWRRVRQVQPPVVPEADRGERAPETASLQDVDETADEAEQRASSPAGRDAEAEVLLMQRISRLMESEQLYLNKSLKLSDLSLQLGVNKNYVSACINNQRGCSFSHFVNTCRVEHAQKLLREHPGIGLSTLADQSGFSSESSFFRVFKAVTGKTPREWM